MEDRAERRRVKNAAPLDDWRQLWNSPETGSVEGRPLFVGGALFRAPGHSPVQFTLAPDQLTPEVLRFHGESLGYAAGPDGKDLGADIDLVGPGPAYERWKKTPAYQEWLKESGQKR
jgi:hypothetical protein